MLMRPDLSVCIVNWNVRPLLHQCLLALPDATVCLTAETIVVDNASTDNSTSLREVFPHVRWLQNTVNVGFSRANNQAITLSRGRHVCFLNPDTIPQPGSLTSLVHYLDTHPDVGIVGPQLRYPDGSLQPSRYRFPTVLTALLESTPIAWRWANNPWARRYHCADRPVDQEQEVDWLNGACLVVRREVLETIGGFDEGFFMYSEEMDLCRRAREAGWRVVYVPQAVVIHHEGKSSQQVATARHVYFNRSKVRYFHKHHGPWAAALVRWGIRLQYAGELLVEGCKWLVGHKRPLRAQRVRAYWAVIREVR